MICTSEYTHGKYVFVHVSMHCLGCCSELCPRIGLDSLALDKSAMLGAILSAAGRHEWPAWSSQMHSFSPKACPVEELFPCAQFALLL